MTEMSRVKWRSVLKTRHVRCCRRAHALDVEDTFRDIYLDKVRVGLAPLDVHRILPDAPPTVGKALQALLRSTPLSQAELVEAADISARFLQRHIECLAVLTFVEEVDEKLQFVLPTRDDRGTDIWPATLTTGTRYSTIPYSVLSLLSSTTPNGSVIRPAHCQAFETTFDTARLRGVIPMSVLDENCQTALR